MRNINTNVGGVALVLALFAASSTALDLTVGDVESIKQTASTISKGLYVYHDASSTAGHFVQPEPWFWWLSGKAWNGLMEYTVFTGDTTYQADLLAAMMDNVGPNFDFVPPEQANWEANDDQMYWVYNALTAMEYGFEPLPCTPEEASADCANSWLAMSTNAFETWARRWEEDSATCGGGLKWQYRTSEPGYYYKNSVTNGGFFQSAARLARYTGNQTFADWAVRIYDWSAAVGLFGPDFHVYDGTSDGNNENCTGMNHDEWSYNVATFMHGAAHMYNLTGGEAVWEQRVQGFFGAAASRFFGPTEATAGVMFEQKCEPDGACTTDQTSFKSSLSRWMGKTAVLVPGLRDSVMGLLETTAVAAAASCVGHGNSTCGATWWSGGFDGQSDMGVQLSALEAVQSLLVLDAPALAVAASV
jgi:mannan endo-1,6-alpha-mannosidase